MRIPVNPDGFVGYLGELADGCCCPKFEPGGRKRQNAGSSWREAIAFNGPSRCGLPLALRLKSVNPQCWHEFAVRPGKLQCY